MKLKLKAYIQQLTDTSYMGCFDLFSEKVIVSNSPKNLVDSLIDYLSTDDKEYNNSLFVIKKFNFYKNGE